MASRRRIVVDDLARLRWAMEPALHPTSDTVAFVESGLDRAVDGLGYRLLTVAPGEVPQPVAEDARSPRWSPDGSRIAFLRRSGSGWVPACRTAAGEEVEVAAPPGDATDLEWSPDGERLLVVSSRPPARRTAELPYPVTSSRDWLPPARRAAWVAAPGADPAELDGIEGDVSVARWSPDGSRIAVVSDHGVDRDTSTATGIWLYDLGSGESSGLVPAQTPIRTLAWSPDGRSIVYLTQRRDNTASALWQLWLVEVETLARRRLATGLDQSVGSAVRGDDERGVGPPTLTWSPEAAGILAVYAEGGRSRLARFDLGGGWEDVVADERCVLEFSAGPAGVAFSWSDPLTPGEISLADASGDDHRLTRVGQGWLDEVEPAPTVPVSVTASDGVVVEGWLTLPPGAADPAPLVLQVHGGPHYAVGERFSFDAQRLAAQGTAVLRANPRGSFGYGQAFAEGNLGDWGGRDFQDLLELVDGAVGQAGLDGERVAVIGESYGGYISAWAVASSDRFAAAVVENGIADFLSSAGGAIGPTFWHSELGAAPWEDPDLYRERSPITRIDRVTAPVLVIHCEDDATCPVAQGEALHAALRQLGREVGFLRVPGEGHFFNVFGALGRRLARTTALDEFLVRHLRPAAPTTAVHREEITS